MSEERAEAVTVLKNKLEQVNKDVDEMLQQNEQLEQDIISSTQNNEQHKESKETILIALFKSCTIFVILILYHIL